MLATAILNSAREPYSRSVRSFGDDAVGRNVDVAPLVEMAPSPVDGLRVPECLPSDVDRSNGRPDLVSKTAAVEVFT